MPRPKRDGTPAREARRRKLTEQFVRTVRGEDAAFAVWDTYQRGLCLRVQPTSQRSYKAVYSHRGRARWCHVGDAGAIGLADARRMTARIMLAAAEGKDPLAERQAELGSDTLAELVDRYAEHAKKRNRSWKQGDSLLRRLFLPRLGKLKAKSIARRDIRGAVAGIAAPVVANQALKALSALYSWAVNQEIVALNPCKGVDKNKTATRERVLSDAEVKVFWNAFEDAGLVRSAALKTILLTGQRPGEVAHMRLEHISDGWWTMPGAPDAVTGWPGTKNHRAHKVFLVPEVMAIIGDLNESSTGLVFSGARGKPVRALSAAMRDTCKQLGIAHKVTPHDLRRTFGTCVTRLSFPRSAMDRILNHADNSIGSVYDRHAYFEEDKRVMAAVANHILTLAGVTEADDKVVRGKFNR